MDNVFYFDDYSSLLYGDSLNILKQFEEEKFDMIFADPPYFLSNGGITCKNGKMESVNKGKWDKTDNFFSKHEFNKSWIKACKRVLKCDGTIWISGTFHNIYSIGVILEEEGFKILNNITWRKTNPPPNLGCRCFTHSTETILWAKKTKKSKHTFNYKLMKEMNGGKQMLDVWEGSLTKKSEKLAGKHPTQKPLYLLEKIILSSTKERDLILDPFCGSGTTCVCAKINNRNFIGIDNNLEYLEISKKRLEAIKDGK